MFILFESLFFWICSKGKTLFAISRIFEISIYSSTILFSSWRKLNFFSNSSGVINPKCLEGKIISLDSLGIVPTTGRPVSSSIAFLTIFACLSPATWFMIIPLIFTSGSSFKHPAIDAAAVRVTLETSWTIIIGDWSSLASSAVLWVPLLSTPSKRPLLPSIILMQYQYSLDLFWNPEHLCLYFLNKLEARRRL